MIQTKRMAENFCHLVSIDSPSLGERQMADELTKQLIELGFHVEEDDSAAKIGGTAGNLYASYKGGLPGEPILFCVHMDTVTPALGKKAILHEDGRITSDGTTVLGADDLTGVAEILEVVRSLKEEGLPHRDVEVIFCVAEEMHDLGSEQFDFSKIRSKEGYVLDLAGSIGTAATKAPTIIPFNITIHGKASHAGFAPEEGIHAIKIAADGISRLKMGRLDSETTFNIGAIHSGVTTNIVPEHCLIKGELRSYSHEAALLHLDQTRATFEEVAKAYGGRIEFSYRIGCYAYDVPKTAPVVQRFQEACKALNLEVDLISTFGGSDNTYMIRGGIQGIVVANAMSAVHSCNEFTNLRDFEKAAMLVRQLILSK